MSEAEVVAVGIGAVAERPVWCADGTLAATSVDEGVVYRVDPATGVTTVVASTLGGPNGAAPASGGRILVAQNGGFDFAAAGLGAAAAPVRVAPSLQVVGADGKVDVLTSGGLSAPNDLVVTVDGTVLFTDSPVFADVSRYPYDLINREGRVWGVGPTGERRLWADGFAFCNGIALDVDGSVLVVEANRIERIRPDGSAREPIVPAVGADPGIVADGICVDVDGRIYAAIYNEHGVRVFEDGRPTAFFSVSGVAAVTNCCFGGDNGRTLFATCSFPARIVAWTGLPRPGLPLHPWTEPSVRPVDQSGTLEGQTPAP
jgi:gluconolactonase